MVKIQVEGGLRRIGGTNLVKKRSWRSQDRYVYVMNF